MVKRYMDTNWMQTPTGEFVRYADYAALEARCREQQTELDAIGRHSIKEQQRIDELEAVLHRWLENDPYPGRVGGVWDATERVLRVGDYAPETVGEHK